MLWLQFLCPLSSQHHTWYAFFYPALNFVFSSVNANVDFSFFFLLGRDYLICLLQNEVPKRTPCGYNYIIFRIPQKKKKKQNNESPFFWIGLVFLDDNLAATVLDSGDHSFLMKQKRDICSCFCFASFFFLGFFDLSHGPVYTHKFLGQQWILMSASVSVKFVCSWICQLTLLIEFFFLDSFALFFQWCLIHD